jgi:catechol 2,3-dioxygenase-like lactoylglutathione lyase family enzyme
MSTARRRVRTAFIFVLGLMIGSMTTIGRSQDRRLPGMNGVNHIAFVTARYDEMMKFYTGTLGFQEVLTNRGPDGQPSLTYIQASRTTFIELFPATAARPAGFSHFGLQVDDVRAVQARLRERGVPAGDPRVLGSGSLTTTVQDPDGNRIEVSELPADAPARKAIEAWK